MLLLSFLFLSFSCPTLFLFLYNRDEFEGASLSYATP